jgi:hypothetical protein
VACGSDLEQSFEAELRGAGDSNRGQNSGIPVLRENLSQDKSDLWAAVPGTVSVPRLGPSATLADTSVAAP